MMGGERDDNKIRRNNKGSKIIDSCDNLFIGFSTSIIYNNVSMNQLNCILQNWIVLFHRQNSQNIHVETK